MVTIKTKQVFLIFLIIILVSPLAVAYDTKITVDTFANHDVEVKILDPYKEDDDLLKQFSNNTGENGKVFFTYSSSKNKISVVVIVRKDGKIIKINNESIYKLENHVAGNPLYIELIPKETEEENETAVTGTEENETIGNETTINESIENDTSATEPEAQENTQGTTGSAVEEDSKISKFFSGKIYLIILIAVFALLIAFLIFKNSLSRKTPDSFKIRKYSEIRDELEKKKTEEPTNAPPDKESKELLDAEKKIKEVQEEIERIKEGKIKIDEAKRKFEESKKELEKLQKEENSE